MTYTITNNAQFNSLEITFDGKPSEEIRNALKALKFRWHNAKKVWYGFSTEEAVKAAIEGEEAPKTERKPKTAPAIPADIAAHLRAEYSRVWPNDSSMIDYCCKRVSRAIWLEDKTAFIWEKPSIEKDFCFGESGYDYDDAQRMAAHARNSEEYFKSENLAEFGKVIAALEGNGSGCYCNCQPYIYRYAYNSCGDVAISTLVWRDPSMLWNECEEFRARIRVPYEDELATILEGYRAERAAFEKRLDNYLKRYGLSKVHSWTYWRDA